MSQESNLDTPLELDVPWQSFFFDKGFSSQTFSITGQLEKREVIILTNCHFHPLTNIQTYNCSSAFKISASYY